jgi:dihydropteroate synthase
VRQLLEWALTHREELTEPQWDPMGRIASFVVRTLGQVGTAQTADVLRHHYVHDAELGRDAVEAVHAIDARTQT